MPLPRASETETRSDPPSPIRILTVCTANICRSPVAERLLQAGFDQVMPGAFHVSSAGTRAIVGEPAQPSSARIIRTYGGTPDGFVARQLTPAILRQADLVLAMTTRHRGEVLQLNPSLLKRTFTIREFARMLETLEQREMAQGNLHPEDSPAPVATQAGLAALWRGLPAQAASVRHLALAADAAENDVIDPYGRAEDVYLQMENELAPAILSILRFAREHS